MDNRCHAMSWAVVAGFLLYLAGPIAFSQQSTERYIPIGESPGVSGEYSYIGKVVEVSEQRMVTIEESDGERHTVAVTDETKIWLDRSDKRLTNVVGSYADCQVGRRIEIMYRHDDPSTAAWMKLAEN